MHAFDIIVASAHMDELRNCEHFQSTELGEQNDC